MQRRDTNVGVRSVRAPRPIMPCVAPIPAALGFSQQRDAAGAAPALSTPAALRAGGRLLAVVVALASAPIRLVYANQAPTAANDSYSVMSGQLLFVNVNIYSTSSYVTSAGNGSSGFSGDGGPALAAQLRSNPGHVHFDSAGNLFIADRFNQRIRKVTPEGTITTVAGFINNCIFNGLICNGTYSGDGLSATANSAGLNLPDGVTTDAGGNIYIGDTANHRVRRVSAANGIITTYAGNGQQAAVVDGIPAVNSSLSRPGGIAVDAAGNLFIADRGHNRIRKVSPAGIISTYAGNGSATHSGDGGLATAAGLGDLNDVEVDSSGNVFITANHRVRRVDAQTGVITTVAGTGVAGPSGGSPPVGDGGLATNAQLNNPYAVAFDPYGTLYIACQGEGRIRKVSSLGIISTVAGYDGATAQPSFNGGPQGVAVDPAFNLSFTADSSAVVRRKTGTGGILSNDADADGSSLRAVLATNILHGTLSLLPSGAFTYAPDPGYYGPDSFQYRASDGVLTSNLATVNISVTADPNAPPPPSRVFMTDATENSIRVVDPANNSLLATIPLPGGPTKLVPSYDGRLVFVARPQTADIAVVNAQTLQVVSFIATAFIPGNMAIAPNFIHLFAVAGSRALAIDVTRATATPSTAILQSNSLPTVSGESNSPVGVGVSPDGNFLYVAARTTTHLRGRVFVFNAKTYPASGNASLITSFAIPAYVPQFVEFRNDGTRAFVGGTKSDGTQSYSIIDVSNHSVIQSKPIAGGGAISGLKQRPDGAFFYATGNASTLFELSPLDLTIQRNIWLSASLADPVGLALTSDSQTVYMPAASQFGSCGMMRFVLPNGPNSLVTAASCNTANSIAISVPRIPVLPDTTPPGAIAVSATQVHFTSASFSWVAVGDDGGGAGAATTYDFRFATFPITTQGLFGIATRVTIPAPQPPGASESYFLTGLSADSTYYVNVRAMDEVNNTGPLSNSPAVKTFDNAPPGAVTDLQAASAGATAITLTWTATGDNAYSGTASSYQLWRSTSGGGVSFDLATATPVAGPAVPKPPGGRETATAGGLSPDTTFYFVVRVKDDAGLFSSLSPIAKGATPDSVPPAVITGLQALTGTMKGEVNLSWTAVGDSGNSGVANRYVVKYSPNPISGQASFDAAATFVNSLVPLPPGGRESLVATGLPPGQLLYFSVAARDEAGNQGSPSVSVSTRAQYDAPPGRITDLVAVGPSSFSVLLSWTAVGEDGSLGQAAQYQVRYAAVPITDANFLSATAVPNTMIPKLAGQAESFVAKGLPQQTALFFAVKAVDAAGQTSPLSVVADIETTGPPEGGSFVGFPSFVGVAQSATIRFQVLDALQRPVSRVPVSFSLVSGGGSLTGVAAQTDSEGYVSGTFLAPSGVDVVTFRAVVEGFVPLQATLRVVDTEVETFDGYPTTPIVLDGDDTTISNSALAFEWSSEDPDSAIVGNTLSIGSQGDRMLGDWVEIPAPSGFGPGLLLTANGRVYAIGDSPPGSPGGPVSRHAVLKEDGTLGTWQTTLAPPTFGLFQGFVANGSLYVFGKFGVGYRGVLDAGSGAITQWVQVSQPFLISNAEGYRLAVLWNRVYLAGGNNTISDPAYRTFSSTLVYMATLQADGSIPPAGQPGGWALTAPLPGGRVGHGLVAHAGRLYVVGGGNSSSSFRTIFVAKPGNDGSIPSSGSGAWTGTTQLPIDLGATSVISSGGFLHTLGGTLGVTLLKPVLRAQPLADGTVLAMGDARSWQLSTFLPQPLDAQVAPTLADSRIYVRLANGNFAFAEIVSNGNVGSWRRMGDRLSSNFLPSTPLPTQRKGFGWATVRVPGGLYAFVAGGVPMGQTTPVSHVARLKLPSATPLTWDGMSQFSLPQALEEPALVGYRERVYVIGGKTAQGTETNVILMSPAVGPALDWRQVGTLPNVMSKAVALATGDHLFVWNGVTAFVAPLAADGAVGTFLPTTPVPLPDVNARFTSVTGHAVAHKGRIYVRYGNAVHSARPAADGQIASWRTESAMIGGSETALVASNDRLFAVGGNLNPCYPGPYCGDLAVNAAPIGVQGALGAWMPVGRMPERRNTHAAFVFDGTIYTFGPRLDVNLNGWTMTGDFHQESAAAAIHLGGSDGGTFDAGGAQSYAASGLSLVRGQKYFGTVRTRNGRNLTSEPGSSDGIAVTPPSEPPDIFPPRTTLTVGLPSAGLDPTLVDTKTQFTFTSVDDRALSGDASGSGVASLTVLLDGVVIATGPAGTLSISTEGLHVLTYFASDVVGNEEGPRSIGLAVDGSAPVTQILTKPALVTGPSLTVEGVAADAVSGVDRVLVRTGLNLPFATATVVGQSPEGYALWQYQLPLPVVTSTIAVYAHAVDLIGHFDAAGSSAAYFVFNRVESTMAVQASPLVASPGSLVRVAVLVRSQFGGPVSGVDVTFSAGVTKDFNAVDYSLGAVPLPSTHFTSPVVKTDAFGLAVTTMVVGSPQQSFQWLAEYVAAQHTCVRALPLAAPGVNLICWHTTVASTVRYLLDKAIYYETVTTQAQYDALAAQLTAIAEEEAQIAAETVFQRNVGIYTITAYVVERPGPPLVTAAQAQVRIVAIPMPLPPGGLPTDDTTEQPNAITFGDSNDSLPREGGGLVVVQPSDFGAPEPAMAAVELAVGDGGGFRTQFFGGGGFPSIPAIPAIPAIPGRWMDPGGLSSAINFVDPFRWLGPEKMAVITNIAANAMINSMPGGKLIAWGMAYGMDLIMGGDGARRLTEQTFGSGFNVSLKDLHTILSDPSLLGADWAGPLGSVLKAGFNLGVDVSGAGGRPHFDFGASFGYGGATGSIGTNQKPSFGYNGDFNGFKFNYDSRGGWSISKGVDGLLTSFTDGGWKLGADVAKALEGTSVAKAAMDYGLEGFKIGLISGDYAGRVRLDIDKVDVKVNEKRLFDALDAGSFAKRFPSSDFGNLFQNLPSWKSGTSLKLANPKMTFLPDAFPVGVPSFDWLQQRWPSGGGNAGITPPGLPSGGEPAAQFCAFTPRAGADPMARLSAGSEAAGAVRGAVRTIELVRQNLGSYLPAATHAPQYKGPANSATGNVVYMVEDAVVPGRALYLQLVRTYNSLDFGSGPFGQGWSFNYGMRIEPGLQDGIAVVRWGDGGVRRFLPNGDGTYTNPFATFSTLVKKADGTFALTVKNGTRHEFDPAGRLARIVDKNGNVVSLTYGPAGLSQVTDPAGRSLTFTYDVKGRVSGMTDPAGRQTVYTYDAAGDLVHVSAPGYEASYAYDVRHGLVSYSDPRSQTGTPRGGFVYNEFRMLTAEKDGKGVAVANLSYEFDGDGLKSTLTEPDGAVTRDAIDPDGLWTGRTNALGRTTGLTFDARGSLTAVAEPHGATVRMERDAAGKLLSFTGPDNEVYGYHYDGAGRLLKTDLPNGGNIQYVYDVKGNVKTVTDAEGNQSQFDYNAAGNMTSYTDGRGKKTLMEYDAEGRRVRTARPEGSARTFAYDGLGRVLSTTDEAGKTTQFTWTAMGFPERITYPDGSTARYEYDADGRLSAKTDRAGERTSVVRDPNARITTLTDPAARATALEYDAQGRLLKTTLPGGAAWGRQYDLLGRAFKHTDPFGKSYTVAFDDSGTGTGYEKTITDPEGKTVTLTHDAKGRPTLVRDPEGGENILAWDAMSNLTSHRDPKGELIQYVQDKTGLVMTATDADGYSHVVTRNENGQPVSVLDPRGKTWSMEYDPDGFLAAQVDGSGKRAAFDADGLGRVVAATDAGDRTTQYEHRFDGNLSKVTYPDGTDSEFGFDAGGGLTSITDQLGQVTRFVLGPAGRLDKVVDPMGRELRYAYDAGGRMNRVTLPDGKFYAMVYDDGDRTRSLTDPEGNPRTFDYDAVGRLKMETDKAGHAWNYVYDGKGRMTTIGGPLGLSASYGYDKNDNIINHTGPGRAFTQYGYDKANRVNKLTDADGKVHEFTRDGLGNLLTVKDPLGRVTTYGYDGAGRVLSALGPTGVRLDYTYDAGGLMTKVAGPLPGQTLTYDYDPKTGRLTKVTDAAGLSYVMTYDAGGRSRTQTDPAGLVRTYSYDALNRLTSAAGPDGTRSYVYDPLSGLLTSETDEAGGVTQYTYTDNYRVKTRTDPGGGTVTFGYDANGNQTSVRDANGATTTLVFDAVGRQIRIEPPDAAPALFGYDEASNQTSLTDSAGGTTLSVYDDMGRLQSQTDPFGKVTRFGYDEFGNQTSVTDPESQVTRYVYDGLGRLEKTIDADENETLYAYDVLGNVTSVTDPLGNISRSEYDAAGRQTAQVDAEGGRTTFVYDSAGRLLTTTDPLGRPRTNTYDANGRLVKVTDALGRERRFEYDAAGRKTADLDALGNRTVYEYDAQSRVTATVDPLGGRTASVYDGRGFQTKQIDPEGHVTEFVYDASSRLSAVVDALGNRTSFEYDESGRKVKETAADGAVRRFEYDQKGRLLATIDELGHRTARSYDSRDNLETLTDAKGNVSAYGYDGLGRLNKVTDAEGGVWNYSYDDLGRLSRILDAKGNATSFAYDKLGRMTALSDALGNTTSFGHDAVGNRTKLLKPNGEHLAYVYDLGDRLSVIRDQTGSQLANLTWDALDRLSVMDSPDVKTAYTYDAGGRMTKLDYQSMGHALEYTYDRDGLRKSMQLGTDLTTYGYDAGHRLVALTAPEGGYSFSYDALGRQTLRNFPNGVRSTYIYDAKGQLLSLAHRKRDGALLNRFTYEYDPNGNRTSMTDNLGRRDYGYDRLDRLTSAVEPYGLKQTYAYDPVGNRTKLTKERKYPTTPVPPGKPAMTLEEINYLYDAADRLLKAGTTDYVFDAVGRTAEIRYPGGAVTSFEYDPFDRPKRISGLRHHRTGEALPDSKYAYAPQLPDLRFSPAPLGVRVRKIDSRGVTKYVADNAGSGVAELDEGNDVKLRYRHSTAVDDLLGQVNAQGQAHGMQLDGLGSVALNTNELGDSIQAYTYDSFGMPSAEGHETNGLKFTARYFDSDTQLQYNSARYLDSVIGRWTGPDPLAVAPSAAYFTSYIAAPQRMNKCVYVDNKPTVFGDPTGLYIKDILGPGGYGVGTGGSGGSAGGGGGGIGGAIGGAAGGIAIGGGASSSIKPFLTPNEWDWKRKTMPFSCLPSREKYEIDTNIPWTIATRRNLMHVQERAFLSATLGRVTISARAFFVELPPEHRFVLAEYGILPAAPLTPTSQTVLLPRVRFIMQRLRKNPLKPGDPEVATSAIQNDRRLFTENKGDFNKAELYGEGFRAAYSLPVGVIQFIPAKWPPWP